MLARLGEHTEIAPARWQKAQEYEQAFWKRLGEMIETGTSQQLDWYGWRARQLQQRLETVGSTRTLAGRILEIGSGPIGIVNFLESGERYALDPLEHFYRTRPDLVSLRTPSVTYLDGTGENLPFDPSSCSLVIIDNVVDHTLAPRRILDQIHKVLEPDGLLYLSVNVHTGWGAALHALLAALLIDKGHPYTFTSRTLRQLLEASGFTTLREYIADYEHARRENLRSRQLTDQVKGFSGLSEYSHHVLARKVE